MSILLSSLVSKTVGQTEPGELFRVLLGKSLAICMNVQSGGNGTLLAVLSHADAQYPFFYNSEGRFPCLSYGKNWAVDPLYGPESYPRSNECDNEAGILFVGENNLSAIRLDPVKERSDFDYIIAHLGDGGVIDLPNVCAPVRRWKIWASAEDRNRLGAEPVVAFGD